MPKLFVLATVCAGLVAALAAPAHGSPVLSPGCTEANAPEFDGVYSVGSVDGRVLPFNPGEVLTITAISSETASRFALIDILSVPGLLGSAEIPGTVVYTIPTTGQVIQWGIVLGTASWVVSCAAPSSPPPPPTLEGALEDLEAMVAENPGTPLADKAEDAAVQVAAALGELADPAPDVAAALGKLEGAAGDLEAMASAGLVTDEEGDALLEPVVATARELASEAVGAAADGDPDKLAEANAALAEGDALRDDGRSKDAVAKYRDAFAKAADA